MPLFVMNGSTKNHMFLYRVSAGIMSTPCKSKPDVVTLDSTNPPAGLPARLSIT